MVMTTIMKYVTLDGRYKRAHSYHFVLLCHFCHKIRVSLPYYILQSVCLSISKDIKKEKKPILHEGLILLIIEYIKQTTISRPIISSPKTFDSIKKCIREMVVKEENPSRNFLKKDKDVGMDTDTIADSVEGYEDMANLTEEGSDASTSMSNTASGDYENIDEEAIGTMQVGNTSVIKNNNDDDKKEEDVGGQ